MPRASLTTALGLQQEQPSLYESLIKVLDSTDQQVLQGVIQEAETKSLAGQQSQTPMAPTREGLEDAAAKGAAFAPPAS